MERHRDPGPLLEMPVAEVLDRISSGQLDSSAGSAAALSAAFAAALAGLTAAGMPPPIAEAAGAQAEWLRSRLCQLAVRSGTAHRRALDLLADAEARGGDGEADSAARDHQLAAALLEAADVPLEVCENAADVVALASWIARDGAPRDRPDAVVAACIAEASAAAAAELVYVNLAVRSSDERAERARHSVVASVESRRALQGTG